MRKLVGVIACLLAAVTPALAQSTQPESQISSIGRGEIRVKPTKAVVYLVVQQKGQTAAEAASANAKVVATTVRGLSDAGLKPESITRTSYSVAPNYEYSQAGRKQDGFIASTSIRADVARVDDVGKVIDAGLSGGATQVVTTQYSGDRMDDARRDALKNAVDEARRDAEAMAAAAGGRLGRLLSLSSTGVSLPTSVMGGMASAEVALAAASSPNLVRPNELTVVATATARWEFIQNK